MKKNKDILKTCLLMKPDLIIKGSCALTGCSQLTMSQYKSQLIDKILG